MAAFDGLERRARDAGLDYGELLRRAGIDPTATSDPDTQIPYRSYVRLLDLAAAATADDLLGLHLGSTQSIRVAGVLGYVLQSAPDVRTQVQHSIRYLALHQTSSSFSLHDDGHVAEFRYVVFDPRATLHRHDSELTLALAVAQWRELTGRAQWSPSSVHFEHRTPAGAPEIERFFGCPVQFSQPFDGLRFPSTFLDATVVSADRGLHGILARHAEESLARRADASLLAGQIGRGIAAALNGGSTTVDGVARSLAMTPRTLQRRLKAEGLQFNRLVDAIRRDLAAQYLRDPRLGLTDVAFLVGYADLTAFHRAFRRWFGQTPVEFRKRAAAEPRRADRPD